MALLTDGEVMLHGGGTTDADIITDRWVRLTPDAAGNYVDGTFASAASMTFARTAFPSNVLPDGRLLVIGGEYTTPSDKSNTGEIYDPTSGLNGTWSPIADFPLTILGDQSTELLANGDILAGTGPQTDSSLQPRTYLYDAAHDIWTRAGNKANSDASTEENWALLPGGKVLSYDLNSSSTTINGQTYDPSTGTWTAVNDIWGVPSLQDSRSRGEIGGPIRLLDGRIFWPGANGLTAFYDPSVFYSPPNNTDPVPWIAGPTMPVDSSDIAYGSDDGQLTGTDSPSAMLPNGHVLLALGSRGVGGSIPIFRTHICEFDPVANTIAEQTYTGQNPTIPTALQAQLDSSICEDVYFLDLPNGHVLLSTSFSPQIWDYSPEGGVSSQAVLPTVSTVSRNADGTYTLTGTYLTGDSEGATDGDNAEMSTNFPIVKLTDASGNVYYCKTTNWTPGVADGALRTTQFTLPSGLPGGNYSPQVCASGLASVAVSFDTPDYGDTHWASLPNGTPITDADPIAPGDQPGVVGANAFASVNAAMGAAEAASATYNTAGTVVVNGFDGSGGGIFSETVTANNLAHPLAIQMQQGAVTFNSLAGNSGMATVALNGINLTVGDGNSTEFDGQISGTGSLTKAGTGVLTLAGANSYTGTTTVNGGTLVVIGSIGTLQTPAGTVTIGPAGTLRGRGTIYAPVVVNGTVQAGTAADIGTLTINNSLTMSSIATLALRMNGTTAGTDYDQVRVNGAVVLDSPTLSVSLGYTPDGGTPFEVIDDLNGANSPVQGQFGFVVYNFAFNYNGGDSNRDVVLTWIFYGD